jgi:hypothetical protein
MVILVVFQNLLNDKNENTCLQCNYNTIHNYLSTLSVYSKLLKNINSYRSVRITITAEKIQIRKQ